MTESAPAARATALSPLFLAWLALALLTGAGVWLAQWSGHAAWLQLAVAGIVWLKGWVVARYFIESHRAHPYIAWIVRVFAVCVPLALVLTVWFGERIAHLTAL